MSKKEISSGTEKAEKLTRAKGQKTTSARAKTAGQKKSAPVKQTAEKTGKTKHVPAKQTKKSAPVKDKKALKQKAKEERKLEAAKLRAEKKQKRLEKKLEAKQKRLDRLAAFKQAVNDKREARRERKDMLKHETKEARIERKRAEREAKTEAKIAKRRAALEERNAKREHRLKVRAEKRAARAEKRHAPGFGGWLAAVISLGVVTLALGTMLSFGWIYMDGIQADMASSQTENLYELNSIVDNLESNLSKVRVANTQNEQVRLLSDIAVQSEMAETVIERFPIETQLTQNMTSIVNKMGDSAQGMLYSVAGGKDLSDSQKATLQYMYELNTMLKNKLNELSSGAAQGDIMEMLRGKADGLMMTSFGDIENVPVEVPKEINDGPFAENRDAVSAKNLENAEEITAARAEELAQGYFADFGVTQVNCTGEVANDRTPCYNVTITTDDGDMWAQLSKFGGKVIAFNSYKDCSDKNFSVERCVAIAEDFLNNLGYTDMKAVWASEDGTCCNLNFVYSQDDVVCYSDMIKLKVCEERGIVTGMEAIAYVLNHAQRQIGEPALTKADARANLSANLEVKTSRLAIIPFEGEERLCWEFYGVYGGNDYYVYVDAADGSELQIFTVVGTSQGNSLM